jgi:hypothetical protein
MRRLPHQGARHGTVDHGDASDGVFLLLHLWVLPSRWSILLLRFPSSLSLACGWPPGANGSLLYEWRRLQGLRVENPSSARKGGGEPTPGVGPSWRIVTEPLKLFPYYFLNHSSLPLSNNTEVTCRLCRVKPGKSLTSQDRQLYIKTHTKTSLEINKSQIIT